MIAENIHTKITKPYFFTRVFETNNALTNARTSRPPRRIAGCLSAPSCATGLHESGMSGYGALTCKSNKVQEICQPIRKTTFCGIIKNTCVTFNSGNFWNYSNLFIWMFFILLAIGKCKKKILFVSNVTQGETYDGSSNATAMLL